MSPHVTVVKSLRNKLTGLKPWRMDAIQIAILIFFALTVAVICTSEFWTKGVNLFAWDVMLISGLAFLTLGIRLSMGMPRRIEETLARLFNRGVLPLTAQEFEECKLSLEARTALWARGGGLVVATAILAAFLVAFRLSLPPARILLTGVEAFGGYIAGWYLGRMASYGTLGFFLNRRGIPVKVVPGHPDGAVGLKPIGDFYFFQAMVAGIPALFLALWLVIIPFWPIVGRYDRWKEPYLGLLAIALAFEILAFLVPIGFFHVEMKRQKKLLSKDADALAMNIVQVQSELAELKDLQQHELSKDRLSHMTQLYQDIEQMPTWPVDTKTRRRFTLNNLILFIPLIANFISERSIWQNILKSIGEIFRD